MAVTSRNIKNETGETAAADERTAVERSMANDGKPVTTFEGEGASVTVASDPVGVPGDAAGRRKCSVNEGEGFHMGAATPGSKVCSYHAMHYSADGSLRA